MSLLKSVFDVCLSLMQTDLDFFGRFSFSLWDVFVVLVGLFILWKAAFKFLRW